MNATVRGAVGRCALAACVAASASARQDVAAAGGERPNAARRIVRVFDFEERDINPDPVPRYWVHGQDDSSAGRVRPGFPAWNHAVLDYSVAHAGVGSVRLPTAGGSTSLMLEAGVLPLLPGADYSVSAQVRTRGAVSARARIVVRLLDAEGKRIEGAEVVSGPVASEGRWTPVGVDVSAAPEQAAYLQIDLQFVQPEQAGPPALGAHQIWAQDIEACAWFDDVVIAQLPRTELTSSAPGNFIAGGEPPRLTLTVRDLTGEELTASIDVYDTEGNAVDRGARALRPGVARDTWTPKLPGYGWYRAVLEAHNAEGRVGVAVLDFVWAPPAPGGPGSGGAPAEAGRFGVVTGRMPGALWPAMAAMIRSASVGSATVPAWGEGSAPSGAEWAAMAAAPIGGLLDAGVEVTLGMARSPTGDSGGSDALGDFARAPKAWITALEPALDLFGQRVRRWQVGRLGDDRTFWSPTGAPDGLAAHAALARVVSGPILDLPWRIDRDPRRVLGAMAPADLSLTALVPEGTPAAALSELGARWSKTGPGHSGLVVELPAEDEDGFAPALDDLARKVATFWGAFPESAGRTSSIGLKDPWTVVEGTRPELMPRPELAVLSTMARTLIGREVVGEYPVGGGARCMILAPHAESSDGRTGALIAWADGADGVVLRAPLGGPGVVRTDLFGNGAPLPGESEGGMAPMIEVALGPRPVIIEGIDATLARFVASVKVEPGLMAPSNTPHEMTVSMSNPWAAPIDVRMLVVQPGGAEDGEAGRDRSWRISPRTARLMIGPGAEGRVPVSVIFSSAEPAGARPFVFDVEVGAGDARSVYRVEAPASIGLPDLRLDVRAFTRGKDFVVEAQVINEGSARTGLELTAYAPGAARRRATVTHIGAGAVVTRRFVYAGEGSDLRGKSVGVSLTCPEFAGRVNRIAQAE